MIQITRPASKQSMLENVKRDKNGCPSALGGRHFWVDLVQRILTRKIHIDRRRFVGFYWLACGFGKLQVEGASFTQRAGNANMTGHAFGPDVDQSVLLAYVINTNSCASMSESSHP